MLEGRIMRIILKRVKRRGRDGKVCTPWISCTPGMQRSWDGKVSRSLRKWAVGEEEIVLKACDGTFEISRIERTEES